MNSSSENGLTVKSFLIVLCLIPINVFWLIQLEVVRYTHPTLIHPLSNVIFIIFWLLLLSLFLNRLSFLLALTQAEVLTIYVMLCVVSSLCSHDMMEILITILGHPFRFATPENEWREIFLRQLPEWLTVSDEKALRHYYEGGSTLYTQDHIYAWLKPAVWWIAFILVLMTVMLCLNIFLRVQWTERERLTYPIIQLPLEMVNPDSRFFYRRIVWFGFGLAAGISILNLMNSIYPEVPYLPVKRQSIQHYFTARPWNAMGGVKIAFYPFAIGIAFLMPLDLLFSCWFFYALFKIELMVGKIVGFHGIPRFPYDNEQAFGAYIGLLFFALWAGRGHFKSLMYYLLSILGIKYDLKPIIEDVQESTYYRWAFLGIVSGCSFLSVFSYQIGMSPWVILLFFIIYFLLAIMIARVRAELGFLVHDLHRIDPHSILVTAFGTQRLGTGSLIGFSLYMFFNRAYRAHPMPQILEAFKISQTRSIPSKQIVISILMATLIGSIVVFWLLLDSYYRHGAESGYYETWALGFGRGIYRQLEGWLTFPREVDIPGLAFMGIGVMITTLMMLIRTKFLWWPLHPLGYAMANSWGMANLWCCLFVAWFLKAVILKQGGLQSYRRAIPFFLGLALGDYILGSIWSIASILTNTPLYQFWP